MGSRPAHRRVLLHCKLSASQSPEKAAEAECHMQEKADAKEEARKVSLSNLDYCTVSFNMRSAYIDSQSIYHQKKEGTKSREGGREGGPKS